jgi:hypothetical protein
MNMGNVSITMANSLFFILVFSLPYYSILFHTCQQKITEPPVILNLEMAAR